MIVKEITHNKDSETGLDWFRKNTFTHRHAQTD